MEVNTAHLESTYITGEGYNKHLNSLIEMSNAKPPSDDIQAAQTFSLGNLVLVSDTKKNYDNWISLLLR